MPFYGVATNHHQAGAYSEFTTGGKTQKTGGHIDPLKYMCICTHLRTAGKMTFN